MSPSSGLKMDTVASTDDTKPQIIIFFTIIIIIIIIIAVKILKSHIPCVTRDIKLYILN
jgi:t-SNARE complex subunit (syntaxin)